LATDAEVKDFFDAFNKLSNLTTLELEIKNSQRVLDDSFKAFAKAIGKHSDLERLSLQFYHLPNVT